MAKKIFISYRRDDTAPAAGRLYDRFCRLLGRKHVFLDVGAIDAGENFEEKISVELNKADVILVLIGKKWMDPAPGGDKPRLFNDGDHVGFELRAAMQGKAMKLPVLIDGAPMPPPHALPEEIAAISRLNAPPLRYETFDADADFIARKSLGLASGALLWDEPGIGRRIGNAIAGGFLALFAFILAGLAHWFALKHSISESVGGDGVAMTIGAVLLVFGLIGGFAYGSRRRSRV